MSENNIIQAWIALGAQLCADCGQPMIPCPSGGDQPGYRGFYPCPCGKGDTFPRPRMVHDRQLAASEAAREKAEKERDDLAVGIEKAHRIIDEILGVSDVETTTTDVIEDRVQQLKEAFVVANEAKENAEKDLQRIDDLVHDLNSNLGTVEAVDDLCGKLADAESALAAANAKVAVMADRLRLYTTSTGSTLNHETRKILADLPAAATGLLEEVERLKGECNEQEELIEAFQMASGLEVGGDPGGVEPRHIELINNVMEECRREAKAAFDAMFQEYNLAMATCDGNNAASLLMNWMLKYGSDEAIDKLFVAAAAASREQEIKKGDGE